MKSQKMTLRKNCTSCRWRRGVEGSAHSACANKKAKVIADPIGIRNGWFIWPINFDPIWLEQCTGYEKTKKERSHGR